MVSEGRRLETNASPSVSMLMPIRRRLQITKAAEIAEDSEHRDQQTAHWLGHPRVEASVGDGLDEAD